MLKIFVSGNVRIDITATAPADYFLVHTKNLHILTTVLEKDGSELPLSSHFEFTKHQFWVVIPESQAGPGNYSLKFTFKGNLTNGITGFYKSVYKNSKGESIPIATTQFESTDAR